MEHCREPVADERQRRDKARDGLAEPCGQKRQSKALRIRQHLGEEPARKTVVPRPAEGFFDMSAAMVDEMHVMHP